MSAEQDQQMSVEENNKLVVQRFWDAVVNQGRLEVVDQIFASDCVVHDPNIDEEISGPGKVKKYVEVIRSAFPNVRVTTDAQITAEGNHVVTRWTGAGTNTGPIVNGIPRDPTGKRVEVSAMSISRVVGGYIEESWVVMETINDDPREGPGSYICKKWPKLC